MHRSTLQRALNHDWSLSRDEARRLQTSLAGQVSSRDDLGELRAVAGVDLGYPRTPNGVVTGRAAVVVLEYPTLAPIEQVIATRPVTFPYVPGLLSFREAPVALAALAEVERSPDLLLVDGHGYAHPRRFGLACHLGVLLDLPTIGCAKSILIGEAREPGPASGDWTPLCDGDEVIGAAVRTRAGSRPIYVSVGHRVSLETAIGLVVACTRGFRLPQPVRLADRIASQRGRPRPDASSPRMP